MNENTDFPNLPAIDDIELPPDYSGVFEELDTVKIGDTVKTEATTLITNVYDYFIEHDSDKSKKYLNAKKMIESRTLSSLLKQMLILDKTIDNYLKVVLIEPSNIDFINVIMKMQSGLLKFSEQINAFITRIIDQLQELKTIDANVVTSAKNTPVPSTNSQDQNKYNSDGLIILEPHNSPLQNINEPESNIQTGTNDMLNQVAKMRMEAMKEAKAKRGKRNKPTK